MAIFLYEIRSTLVRSLGLVKKGEDVKKEHIDHLRQILGISKVQMQNIYLRNENENQGKEISIVQALMDEEIKGEIIKYIDASVSKDKRMLPDLNIWGIKNYPEEKITQDGYKLLVMDDKFIIKVKPEKVYNDIKKEFEETGRQYMRIYFRR